MTKETGAAGLFRPIAQRRAFEEIFLQIEQSIIEGRLSVGDRLPPEREMAETFKVSRPAVREALRILEAFGVVTARRGTGAESGSIISAVEPDGMVSLLRMYSVLMRIPLSDLVDVREALEVTAARAAARSATDAEFEELEDVLDRMRDVRPPGEFFNLDAEFHTTLAQISGNAVLPLLMNALRQTIAKEMFVNVESTSDFEPLRRVLLEQHDEIVKLLRARDVDGAAETMSAHIRGYYGRAVQRARELGEQTPLQPAQ